MPNLVSLTRPNLQIFNKTQPEVFLISGFLVSKFYFAQVRRKNTKSIVREKKKKTHYCIYDPLGVNLLARLRLQFSHLHEHKF